jgi:hypothetical protein
MYTHNQVPPTYHCRASSTTYPLVTLPPIAHRLTRRIATHGNIDADTEQMLILSRHEIRQRTNIRTPRKRRNSEQSYHPSSQLSSHIPPPYLPTLMPDPAHHQSATWKQCSTSTDNLEFLDSHTPKKRRMKTKDFCLVVETVTRDAHGLSTSAEKERE